MSRVIMQIISTRGAEDLELHGQYLRLFDFDDFEGMGNGVFTTDPKLAMVFSDAAKALEFWKTQSTVKPFRDDGEPNRPLTATTIKLVPYDG